MIVKTFVILTLIYFSNYFFKNNNSFQSNTGSKHQKFANKSIPLTGGIFLTIPIIYFLFEAYPIIIFVYSLIFILGIFSDLNIIESPKKRFIFQLLILILFTIYTKSEVLPSRISSIDELFLNTFISFLFTSFCLMVLINGSNFIDGLNGLFLGYFSIVLFIIYKLNFNDLIILEAEQQIILSVIILFVLVLNFFNQLFLGDNGAYSLGFLLGIFLIKIYNINNIISPYFIILLLWYPCFENLFSIIRKLIHKKNPLKPDNDHLHHYVFLFFIKKFKINNLWSNNLASIFINSFNFIIIYFGSKNFSYTIFQIQLIIFAVISYVLVYFVLKKLLFKTKNLREK